MKTINFAGNCFRDRKKFSMAKGVISTKVGYANGSIKNPSYEDLGKGRDDASETVNIEYDETFISLEKLLEYYLRGLIIIRLLSKVKMKIFNIVQVFL